jgi:hypothetical protein
MTFLLILIVTAVALGAYTVRLVTRDGRGPQRPPASHFVDNRFLSPLSR